MSEEYVDKMADLTTGRKIILFAVPSIILMVFTSSYSMVDGLFISIYVNTDALAALNILTPLITVFTATGFLFATGGSALVNKKVGEGHVEEARRDFSLIVLTAFIISLIFTILGYVFIDNVVDALGADSTLHDYAKDYGRICILFATLFVLQLLFNQFLILAGKPTLSLAGTVIGGLGNLVFDYLLIVPGGMGIAGAAWASAIGCGVPCFLGIAFFALSKKSPIKFVRPSRSFKTISDTASNGVSEMVSEASSAVTIYAFNITLMNLTGSAGVAALSVMSYAQFIAISIILGYSMGVAPIMSYNHGARKTDVMHTLFVTSMKFILAVSVITFAFIEILAPQIINVFASNSPEVSDIAVDGLRIYSVAFLFMGINLYASSLFTSLSNGRMSAIISFTRGLLIIVPMLFLLSWIMGLDGVWASVPITEVITLTISVLLITKMAEEYGYGSLHIRICQRPL